MTRLFLPLSVDYADDPRLEIAGEKAELLFIRARCAMKERETDGNISDLQLRKLGLPGVVARADKLVSAGVWQRTASGYHDPAFLDENLTAADLDNLRSKMSRGGQAANHKRWHAVIPNPDCAYCPSDQPTDQGSDRPPDPKVRVEVGKVDRSVGKSESSHSEDYAPPSIDMIPPGGVSTLNAGLRDDASPSSKRDGRCVACALPLNGPVGYGTPQRPACSEHQAASA